MSTFMSANVDTNASVLESSQDAFHPAMPSLNHSYLCLKIIEQLLANKTILPLPELTLDVGDVGLTPDIAVFLKAHIKPNLLRDMVRMTELPLLAIEVISPTQPIQAVLEKATLLVQRGVKAVWTVEPYGRTVFVTTSQGETLYHEEWVESEGIGVDFRKVFNASHPE